VWVNAGATQFHLPIGAAQRLRGTVDLVMPDRQALLGRLHAAAAALAGTAFAFDERADHIALSCPWGNRLRVFEPVGAVRLSIVNIDIDVSIGSAAGIARFYREVLAAGAGFSTSATRRLVPRVFSLSTRCAA
jgi:hypothetical protein